MQPGAHNEMNELSRTGGGIGIKLPFLPLPSSVDLSSDCEIHMGKKDTHKIHFNKD